MKLAICSLVAALAALFSTAGAAETLHLGDAGQALDFAAASAGDCTAGCCAQDVCCGPPGGCFYVQVEGLLLDRNSRSDRVAVIRVAGEGLALPGDTVLTASDADFDWDGGLRAVF